MTTAPHDTHALERELGWLGQCIDTAIRAHFGPAGHRPGLAIEPPAPPADGAGGGYGGMVREHGLTTQQRLVLMLALAPHVRPQLLDPFLLKNEELGRPYTEFGGAAADGHGGFWPTVETAAFLLAGTNLERRIELHGLFGPRATLVRQRLIALEQGASGHALFGSRLAMSRHAVEVLTTGKAQDESPGSGFPARRMSTPLEWDDLVLDPGVRHDIEEIRAWIEHGETLLRDWRLQALLKPGFRSLFYGPPGTGKTLTASLLGKVTGMDVYRVDLSLLVSKYIGETEKNLAAVFDQAERQRWILFFDEADALFSKRTGTSNANDRHANQEVAYLLQRLEDFPGVVILATNLKGNIDDAFARRFQSMVYFPTPKAPERLRLWRKAFADEERLAPDVSLEQMAREFELSGGAIANVLRYAALMCLRRGAGQVSAADIRQGVRRELWKEGKLA